MEVGDQYVVTGGYDWTLGTNSALAWVTRYTETGELETLPSLNTGRYDHACSSFVNDGGHTVSSSSLFQSTSFPWDIMKHIYDSLINNSTELDLETMMTPLLQVLLVTGGQHRRSQWKYLDSTEILIGSSWSYSASLPFPVYQFTAASLHSSVFVFGRSFVSVLSD